LRGLAILLVVFLHNFRFMNYFFFGWLGVDLFFVLSGFLITGILVDSLGQPHFLRNFYLRRIFRIFPLFYLALVLFLFIVPAIKSLHVNAAYYQENQAWIWTYLQNWLFIFRAPYGDQVLLHTWSLAVEEQFYLFWPLIILLLRKPGRLLVFSLVLLILTGLARYLVWSFHVEELAYSSLYTFTRIDGLCIGAMVALLVRSHPGFIPKYTTPVVLLMAGVNFAFYFLNGARGFTLPYLAFVGYTTFAVLFGLLVYECVQEKSVWVRLLLGNRVMRFFGRISYGLYVYHWPVYILLFDYLKNWAIREQIVSGKAAELLSAVLSTIAAIIISVLSYRYFESYFLKFKKRFS
jgi:peptidoglycan/LPS O-acetylase OafA/YrhL